ncbi:MAG: DMT family transporter [Patescibacteria group bacterium]|nr:DMT family transporter [Patescibacteria group bacterium]
MSWQILIAVSVVTYSVAVLFQRVLLRGENSHPVAFAIFFQVIVGLMVGLLGLLFLGMRLPANYTIWKNLLLSVALYTPYNIFVYKALKALEASKFTVVLSSRVLFTALASTVFLNESLSSRQILGSALILSAVVLVNLKRGLFSLGRGEGLTILAAIFLGLANTNDRFILKSTDLYAYTAFAFLAPALVMSLIYPREIKFLQPFFKPKEFLTMLFLGLIFTIASLTFFGALKVGHNSSQIIVVNLTNVILTVILALIFLKETGHWLRKLLGAFVAFAGLILVG